MHYSAAYYPELWDEKTIAQDIEQMKKVGLNAVRIGEFAWSKMEKREGEIDLTFFRDIITRLHENGINTILCTPTPTPPIWMTDGHPERLFVTLDGEVMHHGGRQHVCTNHPHMRRCSDRIVEAMAKELGSLPGVIAWQLDNELKCHVHECACETCVGLWHDWLRRKYDGDIEKLNNAWGAQIWSEEYNDFDQVPPPLKTPLLYNSSLKWNYIQFSEEKIAEFAGRQAEIIRKYSAAPITHNACPAFGFNHESLFGKLDFVSFDMYPASENFDDALLYYDLYRGLGQDGFYWLMETSTSYNGCLMGGCHPHPEGYLEAELFAAAASGAEVVSYWLWRQQRSGCEQMHGSVLSSWGAPTIGYEPAVRVGKMFGCLDSLLRSTKVPESPVALSYSDEARRMFEVEPLDWGPGGVDYIRVMCQQRKLLSGLNTPVDIVWRSGSVDGYRLLVTPNMPYLPDELIEKGKKLMENGGVWVVGPLSSYRTSEVTVPTDAALHCLEDAFDFRTAFYPPLNEPDSAVTFQDVTAQTRWFGAVFEETENVRVLARYSGGFNAGKPAAIALRYGKGTLILNGAPTTGEDGERLQSALYAEAMELAGICPDYKTAHGTVCYIRESPNERYLFCVNLDGKGGEVRTAGGWKLLCGHGASEKNGAIALDAYGYAVLMEE